MTNSTQILVPLTSSAFVSYFEDVAAIFPIAHWTTGAVMARQWENMEKRFEAHEVIERDEIAVFMDCLESEPSPSAAWVDMKEQFQDWVEPILLSLT